MNSIGTLPGERLAGLSADLFHKVQKGIITLDELVLFTQRKNPFAFVRNEHGHIILEVTGLDLLGEQEIERLQKAGYHVSDFARSCLIKSTPTGYDAKHRLVEGQLYKIALVPGIDIKRDADRTTDALQKLGTEKYGYSQPLAGVVLRIREQVSDKQMEEMGFWYIAGLHEPIEDSDGGLDALRSDRGEGGRGLRACFRSPDRTWLGDGAFAFVVPSN